MIEKRTGVLRFHFSRLENGHAVSSVDTLEKFADALEVPLYRIFLDGEEPVTKPKGLRGGKEVLLWGSSNKESQELLFLSKALSRMDDERS